MNKYRFLVGALAVLLGAYLTNVFLGSKEHETGREAGVATRKVAATEKNVRPSSPNQTNVGELIQPVSKSPERTDVVQRSQERVTDGFASLSKEERIRQITASVDLGGRRIITKQSLSQANQEKLRSLLIDRSLSRWDAHDIATATAPPNQDSLNRALEVADIVSDDAIAQAFGPDVLDRIHSMIEARPYIARINEHYDPAMAQAGVPLMAEQILPLAEIFYHTFGSSNNPQIEANRQQVDPVTGLTPLDLIALERAKAVLTQAQLEIVRQKIAALNRTYYLGKS